MLRGTSEESDKSDICIKMTERNKNIYIYIYIYASVCWGRRGGVGRGQGERSCWVGLEGEGAR